MIINTTGTIRSDIKNAIHTLESFIEHEATDARKDVENDVKHEVANIAADVSPVIHKIEITPRLIGNAVVHDITVTCQHAAGEVKRIVLSGVLTVEKLLGVVTTLATPTAASAPAPTPAAAPAPTPTAAPAPTPAAGV